ncbi:flagellar biosynthetic protein FliO [Halalkalibacter urbisdiaboli]|uniref:flagellar biosynthetic protein FliO n=1 Tax=Halalkalibacter urbisdiaboli TaxID=1960589 RepID=UPI000B438B07|nr:flagellar biosynthetic protein FliO [Halalkalibacter urbisdiaboli]
MRLIQTITCFVIVFSVLFQSPVAANQQGEDASKTVLESLNQEQEANPTQAPNDSQAPVNDESKPVEQEEIAEEPGLPEQSTAKIFAQMLGALAFVIFLLYVILRFINKRTRAFRSTQLLQNVGGVPLGANRSVQLVKVGNRVLVVGVGETIQLLKEIEDESEIKQLMTQQQEQFSQIDIPINKMTSWINRRLRGEDSTYVEANSSPKNQDAFKALLSKQLSDVSKSQKQIHDAVREREK